MAIGTITIGTPDDSNNAAPTPTYPASLSSGDLLVLVAATRGGASTSFNDYSGDGWSEDYQGDDATTGMRWGVWTKESDGTEAGTFSCAKTGGAAGLTFWAAIYRVPGADTASPVDVSTPNGDTFAGTANPVTGSVSAGDGDGLIAVVMANDNTMSFTPPSGFTELFDSQSSLGTDATMSAAWDVQSGAGSPTATFTTGGTTTSDSWSALLIGIPVAAGGPVETPLTLDASATGSVAMSKPASRLRSLSPSVSVTATLARPASLFRALAAGATATPSTSRVTSRLRTLAASAAGTGTVARVTARARDLSVTATGTAALSSSKVFLRTLAVAVSGAVSLARPASLARTLAAAVTGTATLTKGLVLSKTLSASAAATASMGRLLSKAVTLSATATATPSLSRTMALFRTLSSSATATVSTTLGKSLSKTLSASATAVVSMTRSGFGTAYAVTLDAVATGTASLSWLNVVVQIQVRRARAVAALTYPWLNKNYRDRTGPWLRRD